MFYGDRAPALQDEQSCVRGRWWWPHSNAGVLNTLTCAPNNGSYDKFTLCVFYRSRIFVGGKGYNVYSLTLFSIFGDNYNKISFLIKLESAYLKKKSETDHHLTSSPTLGGQGSP